MIIIQLVKRDLLVEQGRGTGRTTHGKWSDYMNFMNNQLTELLTNYGPIGAIFSLMAIGIRTRILPGTGT